MSALVPGWSSHTITDRIRPRCAGGAQFEVLVRRRPRSGNTAQSSVGVVADGLQLPCPKHDIQKLSCDSTPLESTVLPSQPPNETIRSLDAMGTPILRPHDRGSIVGSGAVPSSPSPAAFGELESVRSMGTGREGIVIGFDTEFTTSEGERVIDSYQFATPDPLNDRMMVEVVILPLSRERISLHTALWEVVKAAELWRSPLVPEEVGPRGVCRSVFWSDDPHKRRETLAKLRVPLVLACHLGSADLTTFRTGRQVIDHLSLLTSAAGGLVTLFPFRMQRGDASNWWWQSMSVSVRDTMSQAPAGEKKLKALGDACGVPKLEVPDGWISDMTAYRRCHLNEFLEYGVNDAVIVVEYLARLWGDGVLPPVTLSGGAASALVRTGSEYLGSSTGRDFRRAFSGLVDEDEGIDVVEDGDRLSYYAKRSRNPVDGAAAQLSAAYASAYHGGLNSCPMPGFYPVHTVDVDAQNAYPTAMALVRDLDWDAGVIDDVIHERWLVADDVPTAVTPFVGFVNFDFPSNVLYPSLPVMVDGTIIYPRTSQGTAGTWVCGPELWLALKLGAEVFCQIGYLGRQAAGPAGGPSLSLRHGVKALIDDRNTAKQLFGKGSLEEKTLKTGVNSIYGKTAQDVAEQHSWNARAQEMDSVGGSSITSPYHAAMTTSLVRAQLLAAMNQISSTGGSVFSVTTDGFITDKSVGDVNHLDLYGLAEWLQESRTALTGDPTIWEEKHEQVDLVNFTTRGNVSQSLNGVCAHNGLKAPKDIVPDSYEDREFLLRAVVTRDARVPNPYTRFPSFQDLSRVDGRVDFIPSVVDRSVSMDYDLKRRPVMSSMNARWPSLPDGSVWEMATFTTKPWDTVGDCVRARGLGREIAKDGCLRTVKQWREWDVKYTHGKGRRIVTPRRAVLMSIVMAHRQGVVSIPTLGDRQLSVEKRLAWLGEWGLGTVSRGDWDNARRPERLSQMLPVDALEPYLSRMKAMPVGDLPGDSDRLPY